MEEEAVFIRDSISNQDPPNAHQAQRRPKGEDEDEDEVFTRENRGDPLNTKEGSATGRRRPWGQELIRSTMQYTDSGRDWTLELIVYSSFVWSTSL